MTSESTGCVEVALDELGTSLCALRLCTPKALEAMQLSLSKLGQLTPVSVCRADTNERLEIFDGIKRWRAAVAQSWPTLRVEVHSLDMVGAKVRLLWCNAATGLTALEEAWVVRSLYRTSKVTQPEIALLLSRDKSWVCRRLMLAESLSDELMANVRLGLLSATAAVELSRLQRCNQDAAARAVMRRGLTTRQTSCICRKINATI